MGPDDLLEERETISAWTSSTTTTTKLRRAFLKELAVGPVARTDDLDAAVALTHLVWDELSAFGTGRGNALDDKEIAIAQRALSAILSRVGQIAVSELILNAGHEHMPGNRTKRRCHLLAGHMPGRSEAIDQLIPQLLQVGGHGDNASESPCRVCLSPRVADHAAVAARSRVGPCVLSTSGRTIQA